MKDNCFTIVCWFLPYINTSQAQVHLCPLRPLSHLPAHPTLPGCHRTPAILIISYFLHAHTALFIYSFSATLGLVAAHRLSLVVESGELLSSCGVQASHCGGFSCCGVQASVVAAPRLSGCNLLAPGLGRSAVAA